MSDRLVERFDIAVTEGNVVHRSRVLKVQTVRRGEEASEIRLVVRNREHVKDPAAVIVHEHEHHRGVVFTTPQQAILVVEERHIANKAYRGALRRSSNTKGGRHHPVDAACPSIPQDVERLLSWVPERVEIPNRHGGRHEQAGALGEHRTEDPRDVAFVLRALQEASDAQPLSERPEPLNEDDPFPMRAEAEVLAAENELFDKLWYCRSKRYEDHETVVGLAPPTPEILKAAENHCKELEVLYPAEELPPWSAYQYGEACGKLSALRWAMGYEWDVLDT